MKKILPLLIALTMIQLQSFAQCYLDRHNTNWYDGWLSCEQQENPNEPRGASHWILYNFGKSATLGTLQIWNTNDPQNLDAGIRKAFVDYSVDGIQWHEWGEIEIPQADGSSIYEGVQGPDLAGIQGQYVLITASENYGADCYGLSEVRFHLTEAQVAEETTATEHQAYCLSAQVYPNPFASSPTLSFQSNCETKVRYRVHDAMGKLVYERQIPEYLSDWQNEIPTKSWVPGIYFLNIYHGDQKQILKLVKM